MSKLARYNKVSIEIGKKQTELTSLYLRGRTVADNGYIEVCIYEYTSNVSV
jgi:hypothetical protein